MSENGKKEANSVRALKIVYVYADTPAEWNCSQWRSLTPSDAINKVGGDDFQAKLVHVSGFADFLNPAVQDIVGAADIVVYQRNLVDQSAFDAVQYWQGMGKPVLVDLDDAYHILPWSNPAHKFWHEINHSEAVLKLEEGLGLCDGLIAPNRLLLSDWSHVTPGFYLPNFAESKFWQELPSRKHAKAMRKLSDRIVIGWGGSVSHYDAWWGTGIREAAERISRRHPEVIWMMCGNDPRLFDMLPVSKQQKYHQPGVAPAEWPSVVKTFDIGVAPLYGPYDQRRSWIKGLEYLLAGVPWIGTMGEPYRELAHLGIVIPNTIDAWEESLENMISNLGEQQTVADGRMEPATQWFAENQVATYRKLFTDIKEGHRKGRGRLPGVYHVQTKAQ